jgi:glycosyltransferase involved in cell wall biosynthesis
MRVLLVCDLAHWVLGTVGRGVAGRLAAHARVRLVEANRPRFVRRFLAAQFGCDVVHFLSPWSYLDLRDVTWRPCAVNLWHMVDWRPFDAGAAGIDCLLVASRQWTERARGHVPPDLPIARMPLGLDIRRFAPDPTARAAFLARSGLPADTLVLGFAGSTHSNEAGRKGVARLWACLDRLGADRRRFVLRMAGHGWSEAEVPGLLLDRVRLETALPAAELPSFYASLDAYLCTSDAEGVPYPALEAMASGAILLATPVGVVPELVTDGENGFLLGFDCAPDDASRALRACADPLVRERVASAARRAVEPLDWGLFDPLPLLEAYAAARRHAAGRGPLPAARGVARTIAGGATRLGRAARRRLTAGGVTRP